MSARALRLALGVMSLLGVAQLHESAVLSEALFQTIANIPASVASSVQGGLVTGPDGALYGASAAGGGACNCGTVLRIDRNGVITVIHAFTNADGAYPNVPLVVDDAGNFLGTTRYGGALGGGVIFKITPNGQFTLLHSLDNRPARREGVNPYSGLVRFSDGRFFTATGLGGFFGYGTILSVTPEGVVTVEYALNDLLRDGRYPIGSLVEVNRQLIGTNSSGGSSNNGVLFSFDPSNRAYVVRHAFAGFDGSKYPEGRNVRPRLLLAPDGRVWGTTVQGGRSDSGTIFVYDPVTQVFRTIYQLAPWNGRRYPDGYYPVGGLTEANGDLFGLVGAGGEFNGGTLYRITLQGAFSVVRPFNSFPGDGMSPVGELTLIADGRLVGVTRQGGLNNYGILFAVYP
jgi:uncharacterized repeat protein (TIGR03803 family)